MCELAAYKASFPLTRWILIYVVCPQHFVVASIHLFENKHDLPTVFSPAFKLSRYWSFCMPSPIRKSVSHSQKVTLALVFTLAAILIAATDIVIDQSQVPGATKINYSELYKIAETGAAVSLVIEGDIVRVQNTQGGILEATVAGDAIRQGVVEEFRKKNVPVEFRQVEPNWVTTGLTWGTPILTVLLLGFIGWRVYASMNGGVSKFATANQDGKDRVSFADVAGVDEAASELAETIQFLSDPQKFGRLGGRAPRGILLYGPPGTGKSLLARAAAGEAGVPFLLASGSSFQEKFAGVGASRVRKLFAQGKKVAPCIIFIDEIDALGRQRGRGSRSEERRVGKECRCRWASDGGKRRARVPGV